MDKSLAEQVQSIDIFKGDWDSSMFEYMTNEQLGKCLHFTVNKLLNLIINLKKKLRFCVFIDDVARNDLCASLVKEVEKRIITQ